MAITKYDLDINKQAIIKPVVILRQGDHDIDTMQVSLSVANEPMDLTGATVTFMGNTANGRQIIDDAHVKIIDAKGGVFEYVFPSEASSDIGEYKVAYFSIILANGQSSTMDFRVQVLSGVDISAPAASEYVSHYDTMVSELNSAYDSFVNETDDKMASTVSSLASSAAIVLDSALARVNDVDSKANQATSAASNAISMASSVASDVTSQASYINSVASSAVSDINNAAGTYVKKAGDTMTGGLTGGQVELASTGDLNDLNATGKYYQSRSGYAANWKNRPNNAPNLAFSVDVIGNQSQSLLVTQIYYVHTTSRMWVRTMWLDGSMQSSTWTELANDANVVHKTGNETIAGDKTLAGKVTATNIVETGTPQSATATTTFNGLTFSFTRVGSSVYVTTGTTAVTTAIQPGWYDGIIPAGYRTIANVEMVYLQKPSSGGYVSTSPSGRGYFNAALVVGDKPRIVAYYPTTDPWPAN